MTIEAIGSIGELIAAIATIGTLFYLARQIRQGADVNRAASQQALLDTFFDLAGEFAHNDETTEIVGAGMQDFESLDDRAKTKFSHVLARFVGNLEKGLRLRASGLIDQDTLDSVATGMVSSIKAPGGTQWWETYRDVADPIVVDYLDRRLADPSDETPTFPEAFPYWARWGASARTKYQSSP